MTEGSSLYRVAGLYFKISEQLQSLEERENYRPFRTNQPMTVAEEPHFLFELTTASVQAKALRNAGPVQAAEALQNGAEAVQAAEALQNGAEAVQAAEALRNAGSVQAAEAFTYSNEVGSYGVTCSNGCYDYVLKPLRGSRYYSMHLDVKAQKAVLDFEITNEETSDAADDFVRFAFIYTAAFHRTVLLHASSILYHGRGIAFLGQSGIGKSTHSALWLRYREGSELLNDDQPAAGIDLEGKIRIYGTPWSGKTPCYRPMEGELKGLLCMRQKPYNRIISLEKIGLLTELLSAASLIKSEKTSLKAILQTLTDIAEKVPGGILENKADEEAAELAYRFLKEHEK